MPHGKYESLHVPLLKMDRQYSNQGIYMYIENAKVAGLDIQLNKLLN